MGRNKKPYKYFALRKWAKKIDEEVRKTDIFKPVKYEGEEDEEEEEEEEEEIEHKGSELVSGHVSDFNEQDDEDPLELRNEKYRCRSAYKLIEIHEKYKIFKPGQVVVDLGCCPGSWTQVAVRATRATDERFNSLVIGLDILETEPIEGAKILNNIDFLEEGSKHIIRKALKKRLADVVISDMAPNTTGIRFKDHLSVAELCNQTLEFIPKICRPGGTLVMKSFDGEECKQIVKDLRFLFNRGVIAHPKASRRPTSEFYYVGLKYKGNKLPPKPESEPESEYFTDYPRGFVEPDFDTAEGDEVWL